MKGYDISSSLENSKVYVKDSPGTRIRCIHDYFQPTFRENPDNVIIRIGTSNLATLYQLKI